MTPLQQAPRSGLCQPASVAPGAGKAGADRRKRSLGESNNHQDVTSSSEGSLCTGFGNRPSFFNGLSARWS